MLGSRLSRINNLVSKDSNIVWDLCCDHGQLGESFIGQKDEVFFVDQVSDIMESLEKRLREKYSQEKFKCVTSDASELSILNREDETIIIAGVGGHTCIKIIEGLMGKFGELKCELIISPQKNLYTVMDFLFKHQFLVISHDILFDKRQKYDILRIRQEIKNACH